MVRITVVLLTALGCACSSGSGSTAADGRATDASATDGAIAFPDLGGPPTEAGIPPDSAAAGDGHVVDAATPGPDADPCAGGPAGWSALGGALSAVAGAGTDATGASLIIGPSGRPVVAWSEKTAASGIASPIRVRRWDGSAWAPLGAPVSASSSEYTLSSAVLATGGGKLFLLWAESDDASGDTRPHVVRWDGSTWVPLGNALGDGTMYSFRMDMVVDSMATPYVAWNENTSLKTGIRVARWTGTSWELMGPLLHSVGSGMALAPTLTLDATDKPVVAWQESSTKLQLRRWSGSEWAVHATGEVAAIAGGAWNAHLAPQTGAQPLIAFNQNDGTASHGFIMSWSGTSWTSVADHLSAEPGNTHATVDGVARDSQGRVVVMWHEPDSAGEVKVHVQRHVGTATTSFGPLDVVPGGSAGGGSLVVDSCDRALVAFHEENSGTRDVHVWIHR